MPIYEYLCEKCGEFENSQPIKSTPLAKCPTCQKPVRRLISRGSFLLMGAGWPGKEIRK